MVRVSLLALLVLALGACGSSGEESQQVPNDDASDAASDVNDAGADQSLESGDAQAADADADSIVDVGTDLALDAPGESVADAVTENDGGVPGDATLDASAADAPDALDSASDSDAAAIAALGGACTRVGELACAGHASKQLLVCSPSGWQANGLCTGGNFCNTAPGSTQGTCVSVPAPCQSAVPGDIVCTSSDDAGASAQRVECGPDLVTTTILETCVGQACTPSGCTGVCAPGQQRCVGSQPGICGTDGAWHDSGTPCLNGCSDAGACVCLGNGSSCQSNAGCCSATCTVGICESSPQCVPDGVPCTDAWQCCSAICSSGFCGPASGCAPDAATCDADASDAGRDACVPSLIDGGACGNCVAQGCCDEYAACEFDSNCANKVACFFGCTASGTAGPTCSNTCGLSADSDSVVAALVSCAISGCSACNH